ncbi:MAG: MFS transporter [Agarilytica sp.]
MTENVEKKENLFLNLILNIAIPTIILIFFSGEDDLGVKNAIIIALAFPIGYGIYDFSRVKRINLFSALGVVSIFLTGGITLLELDPKYIAIKEAAIPAIFGLATIISLYTPYPLVKTFLYNKKIIQVDRVTDSLKQYHNESAFYSCLRNATFMVASSFFMSSALNYGLARYLLKSPPGTEEFNAELGRMTALSFPVIAVPSMLVLMVTFFYLYKSITRLTHLGLEEIFVDPETHKQEEKTVGENE